MKYLPFLLSITLIWGCQQPLPEMTDAGQSFIRLNQLGYYPEADKKLVVVDSGDAQVFWVVDLDQQKVVFEATLSAAQNWELSGETVKTGDFSGLTKPGQYAAYVPGIGYSYAFEVKSRVYQGAFQASIRALYYHRASMAIEEAYGGQYARASGHPDDAVPFHPVLERSGTINAPGGWYDAGDYGKYVVNGAYSLAQMLVLLEQYPDIVPDGTLNIPESGNGVSDLLDELTYEMDWLLRMQDADGGVFTKLTAERFEGMISPQAAVKQRYIYPKSTAAALDFAATAARFSRVVATLDPAYSGRCLEAALKAWDWAQQNPEVDFINPEGTVTGQYGDKNFAQEWYWAAAELWVTTKEAPFLDLLHTLEVDFSFTPGESWANHMHYLGAIAMLDHAPKSEIAGTVRDSLTQLADAFISQAEHNAYFQPLSDFHWGSNSDILNAAYILAQVYRLTQQPKYLHTAQGLVDYIMGKNAVGYSFITGFGDQTPQHLHHRPSASDSIAEPLPGFLSGGPNRYLHDSVYTDYPTELYQMTSWADQQPSFASNEVCLNWNAPLTYVLGFLEQEAK